MYKNDKNNEAKGLKATTISIAKFSKQKLYWEQQRKVKHCNIGKKDNLIMQQKNTVDKNIPSFKKVNPTDRSALGNLFIGGSFTKYLYIFICIQQTCKDINKDNIIRQV